MLIRTRAVYHIGVTLRRRMRHRVVPFGLLFVVDSLGLSPGEAGATDCSGLVSTCVNDDVFWPHAGAARFEAVGSTETLDSQSLGFGLVTSYLSRPLVLASRSPGDASEQNVIDDQVNGTFLWAYGVTRHLQLDFALPLTFGQGGTGLAPVTGGAGLRDTAVRDLRFGAAYGLVGERQNGASKGDLTWGLTARMEVSAPTGDHDQLAGDRSAVWGPSLAADIRQGRFFAGAELGMRIRPTTEIVGTKVGTQLAVAAGVGADVLPHGWLSVTFEGWALPTLVRQDTLVRVNDAYANASGAPALVPAEWQLAARTAPVHDGDLSFQLGGGGPLPLEPSSQFSPRFRFNLGIRWAPIAQAPRRDSNRGAEHDGVKEREPCPDTPGPGAPDGCPPVGSSLPGSVREPVPDGSSAKGPEPTSPPPTGVRGPSQ